MTGTMQVHGRIMKELSVKIYILGRNRYMCIKVFIDLFAINLKNKVVYDKLENVYDF